MNDAESGTSLARVLSYLESFINYERTGDYPSGPARLGTLRMEELMGRLDSPHLAAPVLHVTGTKGKGSTAHLAARLLRALGCRVGLFTSPHVKSFPERIQIDCKPIGDESLGKVFARVRPAVEAMRRPRVKPPTYFEIVTALAFTAFAEAGVDVTVLEVGLGGRLDATNLPDLPTRACAVTPISRDHTHVLGDDLAAIAAEKAGIMRPDTSVVLACQQADAQEVLLQQARSLGCTPIEEGRGVRINRLQVPPSDLPEAPQRLDLQTWRAAHIDVPLPLLGRHQANNAALALALVEAFLEKEGKGPVDTASLRRAWREITLPGRIEFLAREPWVILDGAHNPASAWVLAETLVERFSTTGRSMLFAAARDKEVKTMLRILAPLAHTVVFTTMPSPRGLPPAEAAAVLKELEGWKGRTVVEPDPERAFLRAHGALTGQELMFVTGSLYLAGCIHSLVHVTRTKS